MLACADMCPHMCAARAQTADKAVVEVFPEPSGAADLVLEVVSRAVSPGQVKCL